MRSHLTRFPYRAPESGIAVPDLFPGLFTKTLEIEIGVTEVS